MAISRTVVNFSAVMLGLVCLTVKADDIELGTSIRAATVFLAGAEIIRSGEVALPAGEHRLIVDELPAGIDLARLQISVNDEDVRVGNLQVEEFHAGELVSDEEQRLQAELEALLLSRQAVEDAIAAANTQLQLLDSLASGAIGGQQTNLQATDLVALLDSLASSSNQSREVIRSSNQELRALDQQIEQKRFELAQVATRRRSQQILSVAVNVQSPVTTMVDIVYPVSAARWTWQYEARLDTESRLLNLERKVSVIQTSGEDWNDIALTITTARPNQSTQPGPLRSLAVDLYKPIPASAQVRRMESLRDASANAPSLGASVEEAETLATFQQSFADVSATQYLVSFDIPGTVTVAADSQPEILPIDQRQLSVDLVTRAYPENDRTAYLEARFTLDETEPLQAGAMQLYRDGVYIGRRFEDALQAMEEVQLPFGEDDRVRVETRLEPEETRDGGTFRRSSVDNRRVTFEVTSFHSEAIELEIIARLPVPQNSAIDVEIDDEATPFDEEDVDGVTGALLWHRNARPAEPIEIRHFYSVRFPENERLQYQDR